MARRGYRMASPGWLADQNLADFRAKRICFVNPNSTSGYLYPRAALHALGIEAEQIFEGQHDAVVLAVSHHHCNAGFALDRIVDRE
jgi:phosphonate transport system substrate-binding protein